MSIHFSRNVILNSYKSGPSKTLIDYIIVINKDGEGVRDVKVIAGEEIFQKHQLLIHDIMICAVKDIKTLCAKKEGPKVKSRHY